MYIEWFQSKHDIHMEYENQSSFNWSQTQSKRKNILSFQSHTTVCVPCQWVEGEADERLTRSFVHVNENACVIWIVNSCDRVSMIFKHNIRRSKRDYARDSSPKRFLYSYLNLATGSTEFSLYIFVEPQSIF